jgi:hypothetical protein
MKSLDFESMMSLDLGNYETKRKLDSALFISVSALENFMSTV